MILCCAMVLFVSGYAFQVLSFSMPGLVRDWQLPDGKVGPLLSAAIFGLLPGYILIAPLADRLGARPVLSGAMAGLSLATAICIAAQGYEALFLGRVLTGVAIGAALPSAVSVASQHGSARWRGAQVVGIYVAFSLGFLVAGLASGALVPRLGWHASWWPTVPLGGALAGLVILTLPREGAPAVPARPLAALFAPRLRMGTALFWIMFSVDLGLFYALQSWLPLLAVREGMAYGSGIAATSMFTLGTACGALPAVWWADRLGPFRALAAMSAIGLVGILSLGALAGPGGTLFHAAAFMAGIGIGGGQKGMIAAASQFYPPSVRATGLGWALGVGRLGAACGPLLIGYLTAHDLRSGAALLCLALPVPVVIAASAWLDRIYGRIDRSPSQDLAQDTGQAPL